jgi:diketogulonate reductase-like aldo/keto reductase
LQGIATAAYGPLTAVTKGAGGPIDGLLADLAHKYAVSPGEICLRWCVDQDIVAITTSAKEQRMSDYLRAMTFKLNPKEIQMVSEVQQLHYDAPSTLFNLLLWSTVLLYRRSPHQFCLNKR